MRGSTLCKREGGGEGRGKERAAGAGERRVGTEPLVRSQRRKQ